MGIGVTVIFTGSWKGSDGCGRVATNNIIRVSRTNVVSKAPDKNETAANLKRLVIISVKIF